MASAAAPPVTAQAEPPLCLLSLDGGGVRGFSELIILDELMLKIQQENSLPTTPKPCEIFDLICGTSTGGIIALILGRLQVTVQEAIKIYSDVSSQIFGKPKAKAHPSEGKFSATNLENILKETIQKFGEPKEGNGKADPEMKLLKTQAATKDCRVFVCCRAARAVDTVRLFRSYRTFSAGEYAEMTIWQAARATSAAPTYFKRLMIGPPEAQEEFLDGGLGSNNPTKLMMREAFEIFKKQSRDVACVVSIGTGLTNVSDFKKPTFGQKFIPKELIDVLVDMATDCEAVEKEVSRWFNSTPSVYFRFNVKEGLADIKLEDAKELGNMKTKTIRYLKQDETARSVAEAVSVLCKPTAKIPLSTLSMTFSAQVAEPQIHLATGKSPHDSLIQDCLKSLAFLKMDHRSNDIGLAAKGTCEWLLRHEMYKSWAGRDQGLLWIEGKPGSGKSTLLRYALENVEKAPSFRDKDLVLSFFFHGRGNELQKTPLGLFRSLLHQILRRVPDALPNLVANFQNWHDTIREPDQEYEWRLSELQRFFESSLLKVPKSRSIWLFVDALDECGEEDAAYIFTDFKSRLQTPSLIHLRFRICFTCRHYPILDAGYAFKICLEHENKQDISTYVQDRLSTSHELTASGIPHLITSRAKGVFMWACLVVNRILALERSKIGLKVIKKEIYAIPPDLSKLYNELVRSAHDKPASLKMFQWICFAIRPLTLDELRWAMIVDPDCRQRSLQDYESMEEYIGDSLRMEGRVKALSCGLVEIVPSYNAPVVQFIHQSVQDFFLEKGLSVLHDSLEVGDINLFELDFVGHTFHSLYGTWIRIIQLVRDFFVDKDSLIVGRAHYKLSRACIRYLAMEEIAQSTKGLDPALFHNPADLASAFPMLHYATTSWIAHVTQSEARNVSQEDLCSYFAWPSETLVQLWLWLNRRISPFSSDSPLGTRLVHILSRCQLIEPLCIILQMADQVGANIDPKDYRNRTPLSYAAQSGNEAIVKLLVKRDKVEADSKDVDNQTPLSYAAEYGYETVVKLLIERNDVEADSKDALDRTSLSHAARCGHETVVKLLIERNDVEADSKDVHDRTPLSYAAEWGHEIVVKLLIERNDVEADSKDIYDRTSLSYAAEWGHETVVKLLIKRNDVKADSKDRYNRTPLSYAAERGHETVVKLLIERNDVEVNSIDKFSQTPLIYAEHNRREEVIKLLSMIS